jgi:hypothetical protein
MAPELLWDDKTDGGFHGRWHKIMHGKPFHATEMEDNPQGSRVKEMLARVVAKSCVVGIRGGVSIPDFERVVAPLVASAKGKADPYFLVFADVILEAIKRSELFLGENQQEPIAFVFADHARWSVEALQLYNRLKLDDGTPPNVRTRMGAIAFESIDTFIPLQAADHLAFETFHQMTDPPGTLRQAMNILGERENYGNFYRERQLRQYATLAQQEGRL